MVPAESTSHHNITSDSADIDVLIKLDSANNIEAKAVIFAPDGKPVAEMCGHTESDRLTLSKKYLLRSCGMV